MAEENMKKTTAPETKVAKPKKTKKMRTYQQRQDRTGYMFMAPWIIGFAAFTLFPFIFTIYLSFTNVKKTTLGYEFEFTGIGNYIKAFVSNTEFLPHCWNT